MKFLTEKTIIHKIIIAVVFVILFNFAMPTISSASVGGILFEPIKDLLLVIADGVMGVAQTMLFGMDVSFLTIAHQDSWMPGVAGVLAGIGTAVGIVAGIVAAPFTFGLSLGLVVGIAATSVGVGYAVTQIAASAIPPTFKLPMFLLTPENMFNNSLPVLDINFFESADDKGANYDPNTGKYIIEVTSPTGEVVQQQSSALVLQPVISQWYYAIRNLAIVALLSILVYTAIRIIISSSAEDKAKYKQRLMDWLVGMCLLFFMHYIMAFAVTISEEVTRAVNSMNNPYYITFGDSSTKLKDYKYENGAGESDGEKIFDQNSQMANQLRENYIIVTDDATGNEVFMWPTNLMGRARIELQLEPTEDLTEDDMLVRQFGYTVIYLALVVYTMLFLFRYLKRLMMLAFLTLIAPLMAMTYPLDKMRDGSAQGFNTWLKEYLFNLLIQPVHLILYTVLIGSAIDLVADNLIYGLVALGFILQGEKILRKFFGFDKASTVDNGSALGGALAMQGINQLRKIGGLGSKKGGNKGGNTSQNRKLANNKLNNTRKTNELFAEKYGAAQLNAGGDNLDDSGGRMVAPPTTDDSGGRMVAPPTTDDNGGRMVAPPTTDDNQPPLLYDQYGRPMPRVSQTSNPVEPSAAPQIEQPQENSSTEEPEDTRGLGGLFVDWAKNTTPAQSIRRGIRTVGGIGTGIGTGISRNVGAVTGKIKEGVNGQIQKIPEPIRHAAKNTGRNIAKHAARVGKNAAYIGPKAAMFAAKTAGKATLIGAGALAGATAGLVSDDFSNVAKWGAVGAGAGLVAGKGMTGIQGVADDIGESFIKANDERFNATHTQDEIEAREDKRINEAWLKDSRTIERYASGLNKSKKEAKEIMRTEAQKYRDFGVTDDKLIIKAMNAKDDYLGDKRDSTERILAAKMASEVDKKEDINRIEEGLKRRGIPKADIDNYLKTIRDFKKWT